MTSDSEITLPAENVWEVYSARDRMMLLSGTLVCIVLFYAASRQFHLPARPGFSGSLLLHHSPAVSGLVVMLCFAVATVLGALFTKHVHRDGGFFCAVVGLTVFSARGGPMRNVLFDATGPSVYLYLAFELALLATLLAGAWFVQDLVLSERRDRHYSAFHAAGQKYLSTAIHIAVMVAVMSLLAQSDDKVQVLAAVGISAFLASLAANWFVPVAPSPWLWIGPLIVGFIGYVSSYFSPSGMEIGRTGGYLAALARPLPLDYASLGVAGAVYGYWISSRWHHSAP